MKNLSILSIVVVFLSLSACNVCKNLTGEKLDICEYTKENKIKTEPLASGLYYIETLEGTGDLPQAGDKVSVHYTGKLLDGTVFDASANRGVPFEFTLGVGQVIKGWDEGIALMKKGGKATLIIPSKLGYGSRAIPGVIPANSTLIFDVELIDIK